MLKIKGKQSENLPVEPKSRIIPLRVINSRD